MSDIPHTRRKFDLHSDIAEKLLGAAIIGAIVVVLYAPAVRIANSLLGLGS